MVYIAKTARAEWGWFNGQNIGWKGIRCGEYFLGATYGPQLTQTLPRGEAKRIESAESLRWLECGVGKSDAVTYLVQVVDEPYQVVVFDISQTFYIFVPVKCSLEPIGEVGRGFFKATYSLQRQKDGRTHRNTVKRDVTGRVRYMYQEPCSTHEAVYR